MTLFRVRNVEQTPAALILQGACYISELIPLFQRGDGVCSPYRRAWMTGIMAIRWCARSIARSSLEHYELMVTLNVGIALYPHDGKTERELMFNADAAMYHTQHMGRNGYHFFRCAVKKKQNRIKRLICN